MKNNGFKTPNPAYFIDFDTKINFNVNCDFISKTRPKDYNLDY